MKKKSNFVFSILLASFAGVFVLFYGILTISNVRLHWSENKLYKLQQEWYKTVDYNDDYDYADDDSDSDYNDGYDSGYDDGYTDGLADAKGN